MSSTKVAHRPRAKGHRPSEKKRRSRDRGAFPMVMLTIAIVALAGGIAFVVGGETDEPTGQVTAPVTVIGPALPTLQEGVQQDPAVGMAIPRITGESFDGSAVSIVPNGKPYGIVLLAHWCSHCQAEVKAFSGWLKTERLPADVYTVSTLVNEQAGNYPPDAWLKNEGWPLPVLVDDSGSTVSEALGLRGTPLWVFVDSQGKVAGRLEGEVGPDRVSEILGALP